MRGWKSHSAYAFPSLVNQKNRRAKDIDWFRRQKLSQYGYAI